MTEPVRDYIRALSTTDEASYSEGLRRHMLGVYNYMIGGLVLTGGTALLVASIPALYVPLFSTPLKWVVMLAPLAFVMALSLSVERLSAAAAQTLFWLFSAVMGVSLASIFLVFTGTSIARTFFVAAAAFGALSLYGYTTKRDLSGLGGFLFMGLIGVVVASLVNLFLRSDAVQLIVSVVGVLVFTGLTAFDTQRIKLQYREHAGYEPDAKLTVFNALALYLNFINLFQLLLNLFGQRDE